MLYWRIDGVCISVLIVLNPNVISISPQKKGRETLSAGLICSGVQQQTTPFIWGTYIGQSLDKLTRKNGNTKNIYGSPGKVNVVSTRKFTYVKNLFSRRIGLSCPSQQFINLEKVLSRMSRTIPIVTDQSPLNIGDFCDHNNQPAEQDKISRILSNHHVMVICIVKEYIEAEKRGEISKWPNLTFFLINRDNFIQISRSNFSDQQPRTCDVTIYKDSLVEGIEGSPQNGVTSGTDNAYGWDGNSGDANGSNGLRSFSKTSVLVISVSVITLAIILLACLVSCAVQQVMCTRNRDRLAKNSDAIYKNIETPKPDKKLLDSEYPETSKAASFEVQITYI